MQAHYRKIDEHRGIEIVNVNFNWASKYYGIIIDGQLSVLALATVQGCKNVIDTYLRKIKK